jgi:hypothetical protein
MIYFIERYTDLPFDGTIAECQLKDKLYDVLVQPKNSGLDSISDYIIDDNQLGMVFVKSNPREQKLIEQFVEERWGPMQELLLG